LPARATFRVSFDLMLLMCITCFVPRSHAQIPPNVPESRVYHIGVGDVVQIDVWRQPELTRRVPVQPDGTIRFPLLDGVKAEGLTATELATQLREKTPPTHSKSAGDLRHNSNKVRATTCNARLVLVSTAKHTVTSGYAAAEMLCRVGRPAGISFA